MNKIANRPNSICHSFSVDNVLAKPPYAEEKLSSKEVITTLLGKEHIFEAYSRSGCPLAAHTRDLYGSNGFINTCLKAWDDHHPLTLTPDSIWITIAQGIATHINQNSERLRHHFVTHEGKKEIELERDGFVRGSQENDWEGLFAEFTTQIMKYVGPEIFQLLTNNFSTTGMVERAVSEIVLMDSMQHYFEYKFSTRCGIPEIHIAGTKEDWLDILNRISKITTTVDSQLKFWIDSLETTCLQFAEAAEGRPQIEWWKNFVKVEDGSGGPYINGHMLTLFPYLIKKEYDYKERKYYQHYIQNWVLGKTGLKETYGPTGDCLPSSLSKAPVTWDYFGTKIPLYFIGGVIGPGVQGNSIVPKIAWAIIEK